MRDSNNLINTINLEILNSSYIHDKVQIDELNTKELVPKMVTRRRLTRASKIAIYLASQCKFQDGRVVYGTAYGELAATANILNSINEKEQISPTSFQNSVYNTAVSYLSMINKNKNEIMTISNGDNTSLNILKSGAIKALDGDTILLMGIETLNIPNIDQINRCIDFLECGAALKVRVTQEKANINIDNSNPQNFPKSIVSMLNIAKNIDTSKKNIIKINI